MLVPGWGLQSALRQLGGPLASATSPPAAQPPAPPGLGTGSSANPSAGPHTNAGDTAEGAPRGRHAGALAAWAAELCGGQCARGQAAALAGVRRPRHTNASGTGVARSQAGVSAGDIGRWGARVRSPTRQKPSMIPASGTACAGRSSHDGTRAGVSATPSGDRPARACTLGLAELAAARLSGVSAAPLPLPSPPPPTPPPPPSTAPRSNMDENADAWSSSGERPSVPAPALARPLPPLPRSLHTLSPVLLPRPDPPLPTLARHACRPPRVQLERASALSPSAAGLQSRGDLGAASVTGAPASAAAAPSWALAAPAELPQALGAASTAGGATGAHPARAGCPAAHSETWDRPRTAHAGVSAARASAVRRWSAPMSSSRAARAPPSRLPRPGRTGVNWAKHRQAWPVHMLTCSHAP